MKPYQTISRRLLHYRRNGPRRQVTQNKNNSSDLNTCPLRPQSATSDKSLTTTSFLVSPLTPTTPRHLPMEKQVPFTDSTTPNVPSKTMTSFTLAQSRREREGQRKAQYSQGSDVSETQYKESGTFLMSCHETIDATWNRTNSVQEELEDLDEEESVYPETTSDAYLAVNIRIMELIGDRPAPLEAPKTIATEDSNGSTRQIIGGSSVSQSTLNLRVVIDESRPSTTGVLFNNTSWIEALPDISRAETQRGSSHYRSEPNQTEGKTSPILFLADVWRHGGSLVPQSTADLLHVFITELHTDFTCLCEIGEMYNDTSWAEVFHDTSWAELFHDTSWFVNYNGKFLDTAEDYGDPDYKAYTYPQGNDSSAVSSNSPWRRIHHPNSHSSYGNEHLGSKRHAAHPTIEPTHSSVIEISSSQQGDGWEI